MICAFVAQIHMISYHNPMRDISISTLQCLLTSVWMNPDREQIRRPRLERRSGNRSWRPSGRDRPSCSSDSVNRSSSWPSRRRSGGRNWRKSEGGSFRSSAFQNPQPSPLIFCCLVCMELHNLRFFQHQRPLEKLWTLYLRLQGSQRLTALWSLVFQLQKDNVRAFLFIRVHLNYCSVMFVMCGLDALRCVGKWLASTLCSRRAVPKFFKAGRRQHSASGGDLWHSLWQAGKFMVILHGIRKH